MLLVESDLALAIPLAAMYKIIKFNILSKFAYLPAKPRQIEQSANFSDT
jgi:hypothetical protein